MARGSSWDQATAGLAEIDRRRLAGGSLVVAGTLVTIGITAAGALYPGYSIHAQTISALAGTDASGQLVQPAATVFTFAMGLSGGLVTLAGLAIRPRFSRRLSATLTATGLGMVGVAAFPVHVGAPHAVAALVAFAGGGVTALLVAWETRGVMRWLSAVLGAATLLALVAFLALGGATPLGLGGLERLVSLPIQCVTILFGGWLLGTAGPSDGR